MGYGIALLNILRSTSLLNVFYKLLNCSHHYRDIAENRDWGDIRNLNVTPKSWSLTFF